MRATTGGTRWLSPVFASPDVILEEDAVKCCEGSAEERQTGSVTQEGSITLFTIFALIFL